MLARHAKKCWLWAALFFPLACGTPESSEIKNVTFRVIPHALPPSAKIYLTGNHSKLGNWQPNLTALHEQHDGSWTRSFSFPQNTLLEFKITRGNWENEAVNAEGLEFPNSVLEVTRDTTLVIAITHWRDTFKRATLFSAQRLQNKGGNLELLENWKYHAGDNFAWAEVAYNDSSWEEVDPCLPPNELPQSGWHGLGWFRLHLTVDSSLWNVPLAMYMFQTGASEVYLNGKLLYQYGKVGSTKAAETAFRDPNPKYVMFSSGSQHVLAVRYSNHEAQWYNRLGMGAGFECQLGELNAYIADRAGAIRLSTVYQMVFTTAFAAFAFAHFLLFLFYPTAKENLYFALSMAGFAIVAFMSFPSPLTTNLARLVQLNMLNTLGANLAIVFGVFTVYASVHREFPRQYIVVVIIALVLTLTTLIIPMQNELETSLYNLFLILACLEVLRVVISSGFGKERWDWITGLGFAVAMLAIIYQLLINLGWLRSLWDTNVIYVYGILVLGVAFSIRLSHDFALTHKRLEQQLVQVKELSEKTLEQERRAKDEELRRKLLEADHARKTHELEEARKLQLAMLPKEIPTPPHLDIAVYMKAASEVGGDYYDFDLARDGTLTVAVGDATDHGAKAGTMVAITKSLFHELASHPNILQTFEKYTHALKHMNLGQLYMALTLAKIKDHKMVTSAAGMPPAFIYRAAGKCVEEIALKGMPLGSFTKFPYQQKEIDLHDGDAIVLMSDGFPERFNDKNETLDYPRVKEIFAEVGDKSPQEIIAHLTQAGEAWAHGRPQEDDVTFVVLRVKNGAAKPLPDKKFSRTQLQ